MKLKQLLEEIKYYFYQNDELFRGDEYLQYDKELYRYRSSYSWDAKTYIGCSYNLNISDNAIDNSYAALLHRYDMYCKALFNSLGVKYEDILPEIDRSYYEHLLTDDSAGNAIFGAVGGFCLGGIIGAIAGAIGGVALTKDVKPLDVKPQIEQKFKEDNQILGNACYDYFKKLIISKIKEGMTDTIIEPEYALYDQMTICPKCGKKLKARKSRDNHWFMGCSGYPECTYTTAYIPIPKLEKERHYPSTKSEPDSLLEDEDTSNAKTSTKKVEPEDEDFHWPF